MYFSRVFRLIAQSRRVKWVLLLSAFIAVLIVIICYVEPNEDFSKFWDVFYFAMVTISTVGYGDITPGSSAGKFFTVLLFSIGVVIISIMTGSIASVMTASRIREGMGLKKIQLDGHVIAGATGFDARVVKLHRVDGFHYVRGVPLNMDAVTDAQRPAEHDSGNADS